MKIEKKARKAMEVNNTSTGHSRAKLEISILTFKKPTILKLPSSFYTEIRISLLRLISSFETQL